MGRSAPTPPHLLDALAGGQGEKGEPVTVCLSEAEGDPSVCCKKERKKKKKKNATGPEIFPKQDYARGYKQARGM